MFKFDFKIDDNEKGNLFVSATKPNEKDISLKGEPSIEWYGSEKIVPSEAILEKLDVCKLNSAQKIVNDITITHVISGFLLEDIKENENNELDIKKAEEQHSDLIPGIYEGGAKIWECTEDLLNYLSENYSKEDWHSKNILDLGCGSGILGIYAFLRGSKVTFQDYNKDVLEKITIPNFLLNTVHGNEGSSDDEIYGFEKLNQNVCFYSGDWKKWTELTKDIDQFDIILTSETIYNPDNQQKLLNCLHDKLSPDGKVLVAAKTYYFGVGGGLRNFEKLIEKDDRFNYKAVWQSNEGVNREIIELTKK